MVAVEVGVSVVVVVKGKVREGLGGATKIDVVVLRIVAVGTAIGVESAEQAINKIASQGRNFFMRIIIAVAINAT